MTYFVSFQFTWRAMSVQISYLRVAMEPFYLVHILDARSSAFIIFHFRSLLSFPYHYIAYLHFFIAVAFSSVLISTSTFISLFLPVSLSLYLSLFFHSLYSLNLYPSSCASSDKTTILSIFFHRCYNFGVPNSIISIDPPRYNKDEWSHSTFR